MEDFGELVERIDVGVSEGSQRGVDVRVLQSWGKSAAAALMVVKRLGVGMR